jgi:hypothetical protein
MDRALVYQVFADGVVVLHLAFICFVALGGLIVLYRPRLVWVHLPCVLWGIAIELSGLVCPLTPLENALRLKGGASTYSGDFIVHYLMPVIYPEGLTRQVQIVLGFLAGAVNAAVYAWLYMKRKGRGSTCAS